MSNLFLSCAFLIAYLGFFLSNWSLLGVERGFSGLSYGPISTAVYLYDGQGQEARKPYFSVYYVEKNVSDYLAKSISRYAKTYEVSFFFYNRETGNEDRSEPDAVAVRLKVPFALRPYDKTARFVIEENGDE